MRAYAGRGMRTPKISIVVAGLLALSACMPAEPLPIPEPSRVLRSAPDAMQIDILGDWGFRPDPTGQADWSSASLDDGSWDVIDAGEPWHNQGYAGYAGVAWYRRPVEVPATWDGRRAYLVAGAINDEYQVFVDGRPQGPTSTLPPQQWPTRRLPPQQWPTIHPSLTHVELTAGKTNLLVVRVRSDESNSGGIANAPVLFTTQPNLPRSLEDQARQLAEAKPQGVWPNWMKGLGRSWTVVGLIEGGPESLEGPDGSWAATASSASISAWLVADGVLHQPRDARWSLLEGHLPLVRSSWEAADVQISGLLWQEPGSAQWQLRLDNPGSARNVSLYVAVRPYRVQPGVSPLYSLSVERDAVMVNGRAAFTMGELPDRVSASSGELGDVSVLAAKGQISGYEAVEDGSGLASLALIYDLHLEQGSKKVLSFAAPTDTSPAQLVGDPSATATRWRELLKPGGIEVPDRRISDAYYASLAYILMSNEGGVLHPGPLLHHAFWYRDSTYALSALARNGNLEQVRDLLEPFTRFQAPDGEFPANVSTRREVGHRRGASEWDSQGQGIHALVEYYRWSRDEAWLRQKWSHIELAARWLEQLLASDGSGLLPPSFSAEDLGSAADRHFWDDFWGVIGFRDAAYAAEVIGDRARASQLRARGEALLTATLAAGQEGMERQDGLFPNGPNSREGPADARGTTPAVWPGQLLPEDLARSVFVGYFQSYVLPYDGAFRHENDNFWPFGALEIAHALLFAGRPELTSFIVDWHLSHPTAEGVWAWGDEVSEDGRRSVGGDMPHTWVAAEYVSLVRDMLLYESGDRLQLAAGVPSHWLDDGQKIAVDRLPTHFGPVSYQMRRSGGLMSFDLQMPTPPPGGYELHLPLEAAEISIDRAAFGAASGPRVHLPPSTTHVDFRLKQPGPDLAVYGQSIALAAVEVIGREVVLIWRALAQPTDDYTVFVHALDEEGKIVAQHDGQPVNGSYPTSLWSLDEVVRDPHIPAGELEGAAHLAVGLYTRETLQRLPIRSPGRPPTDVFLIPLE